MEAEEKKLAEIKKKKKDFESKKKELFSQILNLKEKLEEFSNKYSLLEEQKLKIEEVIKNCENTIKSQNEKIYKVSDKLHIINEKRKERKEKNKILKKNNVKLKEKNNKYTHSLNKFSKEFTNLKQQIKDKAEELSSILQEHNEVKEKMLSDKQKIISDEKEIIESIELYKKKATKLKIEILHSISNFQERDLRSKTVSQTSEQNIVKSTCYDQFSEYKKNFYSLKESTSKILKVATSEFENFKEKIMTKINNSPKLGCLTTDPQIKLITRKTRAPFIDFYCNIKLNFPSAIVVDQFLSSFLYTFRNVIQLEIDGASTKITNFHSLSNSTLTYLSLTNCQIENVLPKLETVETLILNCRFSNNEVFYKSLECLSQWKDLKKSQIHSEQWDRDALSLLQGIPGEIHLGSIHPSFKAIISSLSNKAKLTFQMINY